MAHNLFQHEDALELGMLFYQHLESQHGNLSLRDLFNGLNLTNIKENSYYGGFSDPANKKFSTGRGGWTYDKNGDAGKIPKTDRDADCGNIPGFGGTLEDGGDGLHKGKFYYGGDGQLPGQSYGVNCSAGGGGGVFGGGSGFVRSGGGGGSSGILVNTEFYDKENEPDALRVYRDDGTFYSTVCEYVADDDGFYSLGGRGVSLGYSDAIIAELEMLVTLNCPYSHYYNDKFEQYKTYIDYQKVINMFTAAQGNGFIIMSEPDKHISFKHFTSKLLQNYHEGQLVSDNEFINSIYSSDWFQAIKDTIDDAFRWIRNFFEIGKLQGIQQIISYDSDNKDQTIELEPHKTYEFILYGAMGGSIGNFSLLDDSYVGGFGGCEIISIKNNSDSILRLDCRVGRKGTVDPGYRAFGGGGAPTQFSTGGGGSTDIRYKYVGSGERNRIAVAGGGGGIYFTSGDDGNNNIYKTSNGGYTSKSSLLDTNETNVISSSYYIVNDQSIVIVDFDTIISEDNTDNYNMIVQIEIDDGNEGILYKQVVIDKNKHIKLEYDLGEVYEPNTPSHKVTIRVTAKLVEKVNVGINNVDIQVITKVKDNENITDIKNSSKPIRINARDSLIYSDKLYKLIRRQEHKVIDLSEQVECNDIVELIKEGREEPNFFVNDTVDENDSASIVMKHINRKYLEADDEVDNADNASVVIKHINRLFITANDNLTFADEVINRLKTIKHLEISIADYIKLLDKLRFPGMPIPAEDQYIGDSINSGDEASIIIKHINKLFINAQDKFSENESVQLILKYIANLSIDTNDKIDLLDKFIRVGIIPVEDQEIDDEIDSADSASLVIKHINRLSINANDSITFEDSINKVKKTFGALGIDVSDFVGIVDKLDLLHTSAFDGEIGAGDNSNSADSASIVIKHINKDQIRISDEIDSADSASLVIKHINKKQIRVSDEFDNADNASIVVKHINRIYLGCSDSIESDDDAEID